MSYGSISRLRAAFRSSPLRLSLLQVAFASAVLGLSLFAKVAKADPIVVGVLSFDNIIPDDGNAIGTNGFTIYNFTGVNSQPGTPDSALSFLSTSILLNGTDAVNVGEVDPGSVQPLSLQFPTTTVFTDAEFNATLNTLLFTISGQNYVASSAALTADLTPSSPPDLAAGSDFVLLTIDASLAPTGPAITPEPASLWLVLGPAASLVWRRTRRTV